MLELKLSDQDLDFVIEVVDPEFMTRKDAIKSDLSIIEASVEGAAMLTGGGGMGRVVCHPG